MQLLFYNIFLLLYRLGVRIAALFGEKPKLWLRGRRGLLDKIATDLQGKNEKRIWIHCSSLGEFEQGWPLIESIKQEYPYYKIVLTFFSPSGYEIRKNYAEADYVYYLPMDSHRNARRFIEMVNPALAVFVKYEFWYYYLSQLKKATVPTILVSAAFRKGQIFFKPHGGLFRKMLRCFDYLFVQDDESKNLLETIGLKDNVIVAGDTRYDRVLAIAASVKSFPLIEKFKEKDKLIIAGSTWSEDEDLLRHALPSLPEDWKLIIAPHEIDEAHIEHLQNMFAGHSVLYSELSEEPAGYQVLIIDNIGMLSSLYSYGEIAYVGGGFQKGGIHNVLEPAVFGLPVFFGPVYDKFVEAKALVSRMYAFPISEKEHFNNSLGKLMEEVNRRHSIRKAIQDYIAAQTGATRRILDVVGPQWLK